MLAEDGFVGVVDGTYSFRHQLKSNKKHTMSLQLFPDGESFFIMNVRVSHVTSKPETSPSNVNSSCTVPVLVQVRKLLARITVF